MDGEQLAMLTGGGAGRGPGGATSNSRALTVSRRRHGQSYKTPNLILGHKHSVSSELILPNNHLRAERLVK